jgi:hypothetical protein
LGGEGGERSEPGEGGLPGYFRGSKRRSRRTGGVGFFIASPPTLGTLD